MAIAENHPPCRDVARFLACCSILACCAMTATPKATCQDVQQTQVMHDVSGGGGAALPTEQLGPDDLVEMYVAYCPELSRSFRIAGNGTLAMPLLHTHLKAAGRTPTELASEVEAALRTEHLLANPVVNISVLEFRSRPVSVVGAVNHPITFQATGQTTLMDALAKAGGLSATAGGKVIITSRQADSTDGSRTMGKELLLAELLDGAHTGVNLQLHGGEEITVPEGGKIFIAGNVRHPGMYAMQSDSETTVVKAIALSQGLDLYSAGTAFIYRLHGAGSAANRDEISVPLKQILSHKAVDMRLMADDILYVPTSSGKRITSKVLGQITGFGQTAGTGLLIYR